MKIPETALQCHRPKAIVIKRNFHWLLKEVDTVAVIRPVNVSFPVNFAVHVIWDRDHKLRVSRINLFFAIGR